MTVEKMSLGPHNQQDILLSWLLRSLLHAEAYIAPRMTMGRPNDGGNEVTQNRVIFILKFLISCLIFACNHACHCLFRRPCLCELRLNCKSVDLDSPGFHSFVGSFKKRTTKPLDE
jgi:hypothetical protein